MSEQGDSGLLKYSGAVVVPVSRPASPAPERSLTLEGYWSYDLEWSPDGDHLYLSSTSSDGHWVEIVNWPSLERRQFPMPEHPVGFRVARHTGDLVFRMPSGTDDEEANTRSYTQFWRLSPDGAPEKLPIVPGKTPYGTAVSPDGGRLAVIPWRQEGSSGAETGVVIYDLADGASHRLTQFDGKEVDSVSWSEDGGALLVAEDGHVWLAAAMR